MKSFFSWFKSSVKIKRWIFLILLGISLTCFGLAQILVTEEMLIEDLWKIIAVFVVGFVFIMLGIIFIQKRTLELIIEANSDYELNVKGKQARLDISSLIFNKKVYEEGPKIVVIGGGIGLNTVIEGLKKYTNNITAIVTMSDYGTDTTKSREALDCLPVKDIKDSIIALSDEEKMMGNLLNLNFKNDRLKNLNFGDIYLTAMSEAYSNISEAIQKSTEILNIKGRVIPVTTDELAICAELTDGTVIKRKDKIPEIVSEKIEKINRIYISPSNCKPSPGVIEAIEEAEAIIIGPGSLYTNVIPNLLVKNVSKTIRESKSIKLYVSNIMTEPGQTDNYDMSDHLNAIKEHAGDNLFNYCLVDTGEIVPEYVRMYNEQGSEVVQVNSDRISSFGIKFLQKNMSCIKGNKICHNPNILASTIIELICNDLRFHDKQNETEYLLLNSILKDEKKLEAKQAKKADKHKKIVNKATKNVNYKNKKSSKFSEKYKERIEGIQSVDAKAEKNRKIAEEIERLEGSKKDDDVEVAKDLYAHIENFNETRENTKAKIKGRRAKK